MKKCALCNTPAIAKGGNYFFCQRHVDMALAKAAREGRFLGAQAALRTLTGERWAN